MSSGSSRGEEAGATATFCTFCEYPAYEHDFDGACARSDIGVAAAVAAVAHRPVDAADALMIIAENFNLLKTKIPDAANRYLWEQAKYCLNANDTAHELGQALIIAGDYPLEMNEKLTDADFHVMVALKYSSLRSIIPDADISYLWKVATEYVHASEEHFGAFALNLLRSGDYPEESINALPPEARLELKRVALLRNAQDALSYVDAAFIEEKLLAKPELCFDEQGVSSEIFQLMSGEICPSKAQEYYRRVTTDAIENFSGNNFDVYKFLQRIPNPIGYFESARSHGGPKYKADCFKYLRTVAPGLSSAQIHEMMKKHGTLSLCLRSLFGASGRADTMCYRYQLSDECARFINELTFIRHREEIETTYHFLFSDIEVNGNNANANPRNINIQEEEGMMCELCEELYPIQGMTSCTEAHLFCQNCVRSWVQERIRGGYLEFNCLQRCSGTIPDRVVSRVLSPSEFTTLLKRRQDRDVATADLDGIENCPWCGFRYVPRPDDTDLVCLHPECGEKWCKNCRELPHHPRPCEDTPEEVRKRTFIEEKMTASAVKSCHKCHAEIIKYRGCDHVVCKCGHAICYKCGKPSHAHYCSEPVVTLNVAAAGIEAKSEANRLYPNVKLNHDPTNLP